MSRFVMAACMTAALSLAQIEIVHGQQTAASAPAVITAADAAPFLGDWTINASSDMGPVVFALSLKNTDGKILGEIGSAAVGVSPITDITRAGANLVLKYTFFYEGNPVSAVVTLAPVEGKTNATLEFADGAFVMTGAATKATPPAQ